MMNCQQFRQYCTVNPNYQEEDFLFHQQNCSECATFAEEMKQFELTLVAALKIEVPIGLTQRILQQQRKRSFFERILSFIRTAFNGKGLVPIYALAASLLLVVSLLVSGLWETNTSSLSQDIIAYLENEPQIFITDNEVPPDELNGMFQAIGAQLTGDIGSVKFCRLLTLQDHNSAHIVLTGTKGPINVIFIRDSQLEGYQSLSHGKLKGIIQSQTWGNLAILGAKDEPLDTIAARIDKSVKWL